MKETKLSGAGALKADLHVHTRTHARTHTRTHTHTHTLHQACSCWRGSGLLAYPGWVPFPRWRARAASSSPPTVAPSAPNSRATHRWLRRLWSWTEGPTQVQWGAPIRGVYREGLPTWRELNHQRGAPRSTPDGGARRHLEGGIKEASSSGQVSQVLLEQQGLLQANTPSMLALACRPRPLQRTLVHRHVEEDRYGRAPSLADLRLCSQGPLDLIGQQDSLELLLLQRCPAQKQLFTPQLKRQVPGCC